MTEQDYDPIARETPIGLPSDAERELLRTAAIRHRAWELSQSPESGSEEENWLRAERELRELTQQPPTRTTATRARG